MKILLKKLRFFAVMITLCLLFVALFATHGCDKLKKNNEDELYSKIIGTWREIYPFEDESYLTFSENDTIYHQFTYDNSILKLTYHFLSENSIQIERLWESETNPYTRKTDCKIVFYNDDSILIEKFYVSDAAVFPPEFIDIKLLKTQ